MNRPLVWVALAFVLGNYLAAAGLCPGIVFPLLICGAGVFLAIGLSGRRSVAAAAVIACVLGVGALLWNARHAAPPGDALSAFVQQHPDQAMAFEGRVLRTDVTIPEDDYVRFVLSVEQVRLGEQVLPLPGGLSVSWSRPTGPLFADERVRVQGAPTLQLGRVNPGIQSVEDYLRAHRVHTGLTVGGDQVSRIGPARWWSLAYWVSRLRVIQGAQLASNVPRSVLPFVLTVWLGHRAQISEQEYHSYIATGTVHILSVSGIHMGIVYLTVSWMLRMVIGNRRTRGLITVTAVFLFALMAGARVPALRSAIMVALYVAAELFDREPDSPTALSLSALLLVGLNPNDLFDAGFLLSFLSIASIFLFAPFFFAFLDRIPRLLPQTRATQTLSLLSRFPYGAERLPRLVRGTLATSLAVQILPLPLALHYFYVLPLGAPIANLAIIPLTGAALWLCFMTTVSGMLFPPAALLFGHALFPVVWLIRTIANLVATIPGIHPSLTSPTSLAMACYWGAVGLAALALLNEKLRKRLLIGAAALLLVMVVAWRPRHPEPMIVFLDVGHGDATFVRTPGGTTLLIDGGDAIRTADMGARVVAPFLWSQGVSHLDYVAVSHSDRDHIGGLGYILKYLSVDQVLLGPFPTDKPEERQLLDLCSARDIPIRRLQRGDSVPVSGGKIEVLHPPGDWPSSSSINNRSLVLRLRWGDTTILFPGDIQLEAENEVCCFDCRADILKAPHHGSRTSSSEPFIQAVDPADCVVSSGGVRGREGSSPTVLRQYKAHPIRLWRTDHSGGIKLLLKDGNPVFTRAREQRGYPHASD